MKTITAIIEKAVDGGYSIYTKDVKGAVGYGLSESEAKNDFTEILEEQFDFFKEQTGEISSFVKEGYKVEYRYDFSAFFQAFPFIDATKFARTIGLNPSLMRKYKNGLSFASEKQKALIQEKFNEIVNNMVTVQF